MESILQSSLLADAVAEEQRRSQVRLRRRSEDSDCDLHKPAERTSGSAAELRLREQALRDKEKALKEREERLERKAYTSVYFLAIQAFFFFFSNKYHAKPPLLFLERTMGTSSSLATKG